MPGYPILAETQRPIAEMLYELGPARLAQDKACLSTIACLKEQACEHYPDSEFAPNYGGFVQ
jgi:hypothetical protein